MRKSLPLLLFVALIAWAAASADAQQYGRLVQINKQPVSIIMIGEGASDVEVLAAETFRSYILKMTGVELPLWRDDSLDLVHRNVVVSIGRTRWVSPVEYKELRIGEALPSSDALNGAYLVERHQRFVRLVGQNDEATLMAVYDFLGRLGCRFTPQAEDKAQVPAQLPYLALPGTLRDIRRPDAAQRAQFPWLKAKIAAATSPRPAPRAGDCPFIVRGGKPASAIVLSAHAGAREAYAGAQLQEYVKRMTGVELPVLRDTDPPPPAGVLVISVGRTLYLPDDLRSELRIGRNIAGVDPAHDLTAIVKTPGVLYLVGHRDQATLYAVYDLLESYGCRWFYANEAGTVIPQGFADLPFKDCRIIRKPDFALRSVYAWWSFFRDEADNASEVWWHQTNRMSEGDPRGMSGHNFDQIVDPKLWAAHPEYFSMVRGKRIKPEGDASWQICQTNPDVIRLSIAYGESRLALEPGNEWVTFSSNDGYSLCECPECLKVGNHADVNVYQANQAARELFVNRPNLYMCITCYAGSSIPPSREKATGYDRNEDRLVVGIWENSRMTPTLQLIEGYGKASHHILLHKCWDPISYRSGGARPTYYKDTLAEYPFFKRHGVTGIGLQAVSNWAANGLDRYLAGKLMWNADADVPALIADFEQKMFPSCPQEFDAWIRHYDEAGRFARRAYLGVAAGPDKEEKDGMPFDQWVAGGLACLEKMRAKVKTPEERNRWLFFALYMHEQALECGIESAKDPDQKVKLYVELVSLLKGSRPVRILDANMVIGKGIGGAMRGAGYPGRDLDFSEIPPLPVTEQLITVLYEKDRAKFTAVPKAQ